MPLNTSEKIKVISGRKQLSLAQLATKLGWSRQNFYDKLRRNNFAENDLVKIAKALEQKLEITFIDENTGVKE